eukprot:ANDGO_08397.mRNA.1 hypothetical protein
MDDDSWNSQKLHSLVKLCFSSAGGISRTVYDVNKFLHEECRKRSLQLEWTLATLSHILAQLQSSEFLCCLNAEHSKYAVGKVPRYVLKEDASKLVSVSKGVFIPAEQCILRTAHVQSVCLYLKSLPMTKKSLKQIIRLSNFRSEFSLPIEADSVVTRLVEDSLKLLCANGTIQFDGLMYCYVPPKRAPASTNQPLASSAKSTAKMSPQKRSMAATPKRSPKKIIPPRLGSTERHENRVVPRDSSSTSSPSSGDDSSHGAHHSDDESYTSRTSEKKRRIGVFIPRKRPVVLRNGRYVTADDNIPSPPASKRPIHQFIPMTADDVPEPEVDDLEFSPGADDFVPVPIVHAEEDSGSLTTDYERLNIFDFQTNAFDGIAAACPEFVPAIEDRSSFSSSRRDSLSSSTVSVLLSVRTFARVSADLLKHQRALRLSVSEHSLSLAMRRAFGVDAFTVEWAAGDYGDDVADDSAFPSENAIPCAFERLVRHHCPNGSRLRPIAIRSQYEKLFSNCPDIEIPVSFSVSAK